jgi:hypothetical protein
MDRKDRTIPGPARSALRLSKGEDLSLALAVKHGNTIATA